MMNKPRNLLVNKRMTSNQGRVGSLCSNTSPGPDCSQGSSPETDFLGVFLLNGEDDFQNWERTNRQISSGSERLNLTLECSSLVRPRTHPSKLIQKIRLHSSLLVQGKQAPQSEIRLR